MNVWRFAFAGISTVLLLTYGLTGITHTARAFEEDLHYDAKFAIALADSWSWEEALTIASADQGKDENEETVASLEETPGNMKPHQSPKSYEFHAFSKTDDSVASGKNDRNQDVKDKMDEKKGKVNNAIDTAKTSGAAADKTKGLIAIGNFLHYQEDTWSHSGYGGNPLGHTKDSAMDRAAAKAASLVGRPKPAPSNPDHPAKRPEKTKAALEETRDMLDGFMQRWQGHGTDVTKDDLKSLIDAFTDPATGAMYDNERKACNKASAEIWLYKILDAKGKLGKVPGGSIVDYAPSGNAAQDTLHKKHFGLDIKKRVTIPTPKYPKYNLDGTPKNVNPDGTYTLVAYQWNLKIQGDSEFASVVPSERGDHVTVNATVVNDGLSSSPAARVYVALGPAAMDEANQMLGENSSTSLDPQGLSLDLPVLAPGQIFPIGAEFDFALSSESYAVSLDIQPTPGHLEAGNTWWDDPKDDSVALLALLSVSPPGGVPALSSWSIALLGAVLLGLGMAVVRRQAR